MKRDFLSDEERTLLSNYEPKDMRCRVVEGFMDEEILSVIRYVEENTPAEPPS